VHRRTRRLFVPDVAATDAKGEQTPYAWEVCCDLASIFEYGVTVCCRPQPNYRYYILDRNMQPCPLGVPGECYISGVGVSLGYAGQPQLTAERFLPNPFKLTGDSFHFDTMYKTGDILAWLPDGNQRILGRVDLQVKLRGFRVELPGVLCCSGRLAACQSILPAQAQSCS
jgi:acyl-CoA synthetase (AMP-forming)/AMP-acid ligase II